MKNLFSFILIFLCFNAISNAQDDNHEHVAPCGIDAYSQQLYEQNPAEYLAAQAYSREQIQNWIAANKNNLQKKAEVITIPVVFHVVWSSDTPQSNVSDEQIYSQIEALNRDFRAQNDLSIVRDIFKDRIADMEIEFRLAEFDPDGNLTTGITRTETDVTAWNIDNASDMKYDMNGGKDPWPSRDYLNIWIITRLTENAIAGYAQPGGNFPSNARIDGVVIVHNHFGQTGTANPNDFGRTGTHEVGHWLSLHHIWGAFNSGDQTPSCLGEDDEVADTPYTLDANFGCNFNRNQCTMENPDFPDMIENYMDYANSSCQGLFTHGQKDKARAILNTTRSQITTSAGLRERGKDDVMITKILSPTSVGRSCSTFEPVIEVVNFGTSEMLYFEVDYTVDGEAYEYQWISAGENLAPWNSLNNDLPKKLTLTLPEVTLSNDDINHTLEVVVSRPNGSTSEFNETDNTLSVNFKSVNPGIFPYFNEDFQFIVFPPIGWSIFNGDNSPHWRFKGTKDASLEIGFDDTQAALMDNFAYDAVGEIDELILPPLDFVGDLGKISLNFYYAYAYTDESNISDTLSIMISDDCGNTFIPVAELYGENLITAPPVAGPYIPKEGEWQNASIDLSSYINTTNHIEMKFRQTRGSGNNLYIDNVDLLSETTDIDPVINAAADIKMFPNPARQLVQLQFEAKDVANLQIDLMDKTGRTISSQNKTVQSGRNQHTISLDKLPAGMYFVQIQDGSQLITKKLMVF
ncbi:MAG: T9SS type A sorting domain-containing protein [Chitinophagales bacterium]